MKNDIRLTSIRTGCDIDALKAEFSAKEGHYSWKVFADEFMNFIPFKGEDNVAILSINSPLVGKGWWGQRYDYIQRAIEKVESDDSCTALAIAINSPGGEWNGLMETMSLIARCTKPTMAFVTEACSAAYGLASACQRIYATEASELGSIGVQGTCGRYKDKDYEEKVFHSSNASKKNLDPFTAEGSADWQKTVDEMGALFVKAIASNRGCEEKDVEEHYGQGLVFRGAEALERKMCDKLVETLDDAIEDFLGDEDKEDEMDISHATDQELKAAISARPELMAELSASAQKEGAEAERGRILKLGKLRSLGAFAVPVVEQAIASGLAYPEAVDKVLEAKATADAEAKAMQDTERQRGLDSLESQAKGAQVLPIQPVAIAGATTKTEEQLQDEALARYFAERDAKSKKEA